MQPSCGCERHKRHTHDASGLPCALISCQLRSSAIGKAQGQIRGVPLTASRGRFSENPAAAFRSVSCVYATHICQHALANACVCCDRPELPARRPARSRAHTGTTVSREALKYALTYALKYASRMINYPRSSFDPIVVIT